MKKTNPEFLRGFAVGAQIYDREAKSVWSKASAKMAPEKRAKLEEGGYYVGCDAGLDWVNSATLKTRGETIVRWVVEYYDKAGTLHVEGTLFENCNTAVRHMTEFRAAGFKAGVRRIKL